MRIFEAIFTDGKVYIQNGTVEVPGAKLMSAGKGDSVGILILAGGECVYLAQTTPDMKKSLEILAQAFDKLSNDVIQATGGTSDVGGATATFKTDMQAVKQQLEQLAGDLI